MEFISFIKGLQKKGKIYYDVWLKILFKLEEQDTIELNRRLDLSKSQYYRIISFGMKYLIHLFNLITENYLFVKPKRLKKK